MEDNKTKESHKYDKYWNLVENALNDGTKNGYKIAVIETEKILRTALKEKNIPGEIYDHKVEFIQKILANPDKLRYSRAMYKKITEDIGFDISLEDTKEIIAGYYKAISDISEMNYHTVSAKDKLMLLGEKYSKELPTAIRNIVIWLFIFFLAIFISSETEIGRGLSTALTDISRLIFYKLIPAIIAILAILFIALIAIAIIKKRKKY